ncbi:hypothetical protein SISNIDRAFT_229222 [Sistotremastrum niveocremeum HHB9708]|uniref:Uncharacterized protein n=1 Tax=Sistotremastrum niveocremeum HHB9708 TaxID=1314777 RepID=A0A164Q5W9_9AGAM|nr:hypothetical protein SISNIDRAFT_229222 [Sistotremastrum niveocremeum HHB9708]
MSCSDIWDALSMDGMGVCGAALGSESATEVALSLDETSRVGMPDGSRGAKSRIASSSDTFRGVSVSLSSSVLFRGATPAPGAGLSKSSRIWSEICSEVGKPFNFCHAASFLLSRSESVASIARAISFLANRISSSPLDSTASSILERASS